MVSPRSQPLLAILLLLIIACLACRLPQTSNSTPTSLSITPAANPTNTITASSSHPATTASATARPTTPPSVATHRIATHRIYGLAEFYDRSTSAGFIPRGVNYFIMVPVLDHYEDRLLAVGVYDHNRTQTDFSTLSAAGYNTVRIIIDGCTSGGGCIGLEDGQGLNPAYLDNIVDLMNLARESNLFLLLASKDLPDLGGYTALANQGANASFAPYRNTEFLTPAGIVASQKYWADLLGNLASRHAPFDVVLGWELISEQFYPSDQPPFSLQSGKITSASGNNYDMAISTQKQSLAVDGMRYYIDQLRRTILTYDPTALITMGFIAPDSPNPWREGDNRFVETAALLDDSPLDFYDLHAYPSWGLTMSALAQDFGLGTHVNKPILMGAVGASTWIYPEVSAGAIALQDWIAASCAQGFSGWLYSGYYSSPAGLRDATWGFVDNKNFIQNALSPRNQPDACTVTVLPGRNLALGKPVDVSAALPDQTAQMAVDGDPNTQWSAGGYPTQWLQIDLGAEYTVGEIRLTVGQWPAGQTVHQLWLGANPDAMHMAYQFSGIEYDFDLLNFIPATPLDNIRYVRIVTTESPSWVSWREIEVLAPLLGNTTPIPEPDFTPTP